MKVVTSHIELSRQNAKCSLNIRFFRETLEDYEFFDDDNDMCLFYVIKSLEVR